MDLDAYVQAHYAQWRRLEALTRSRPRTGAEVDEFTELYQQVATQLSVVRTSAPDAMVVSYLSSVLARARNRAVGTRATTWAGIAGFFTRTFPAALYRTRRWWLTTMAANAAVVAVLMLWLQSHPNVEQTLLSPEEIDQLVNHQFEDYYHQYAASHFAAQVWTNNAWVSMLCIAFGILGFPVILLLWRNIVNLAVIGSIMTRHGHAYEFWGLILPHGMLELTAVFVAAATGLRLFWSWVEPGGLPRAQAMAHEGRSAATVALGLVVVLLVSGVIEAFVTPSPLPTWARLVIGALAEIAFGLYVFVLGRIAFHAGATGDLDAALLEDSAASAA